MPPRAMHFCTLVCHTFSFYDVEIITLLVMICTAMGASGVTPRVRARAVSRRVFWYPMVVAFCPVCAQAVARCNVSVEVKDEVVSR